MSAPSFTWIDQYPSIESEQLKSTGELSPEVNGRILLSDLKTQNSSPKEAILGDKGINKGNYIFIYGSLADQLLL